MDTANVTYITEPILDFEQQYSKVRSMEGRLLSDNEVMSLPNVSSNSPQYVEWKMRAWMLKKFSEYLKNKQPKNMLDIGCGNGWMTNYLSQFTETITGLDVGRTELEQAARCFATEKVKFICCSDLSLLQENSFDSIFFAGSLHYFKPNEVFWKTLLNLLKPEGEIHILETQFYSNSEIEGAKSRSEEYYSNLGVKVDYYNHLSWDVLPENAEVLYRPRRISKLFSKKASPFPWIKIHKV